MAAKYSTNLCMDIHRYMCVCVYAYVDVQAELRKGRGTRHQIANIHCIIRKTSRDPQKRLLLIY